MGRNGKIESFNVKITDVLKDIAEIKASVAKANDEMGHVRESMAGMKVDNDWFKKELGKLGSRQWQTVVSLGVGIVVSILLILLK